MWNSSKISPWTLKPCFVPTSAESALYVELVAPWVIAFCRTYKPARLRGAEVRFIRSVLAKSAKDFANCLSVTPEHLSRIENERERMSERLDKLVRARAALYFVEAEALRGLFNLQELQTLLDGALPASDNPLALILPYSGLCVGENPEPVQFEFRPPAPSTRAPG